MVRALARTAVGVLALAAALSGCRTAPQPTIIGPGADAPWTEQLAALEKLDRYALTGRVAVAANGQGFSGTLRYRQAGQRADLSIDGPMGLGGLRLVADGEDVSVATSKGDKLDGNAAREELERLRLIKQMVDGHGINLAGVQRLLAVAEVMQRIEPLLDESALSTGSGRRQLLNEMKRLNELLGL